MCAALIRRVKELHIPLRENVRCVQLLKIGNRVCGAVFRDSQNENGELVPVLAENIVFAVGGPGNLYEHSVYPVQHSLTSIGLALAIGAEAHNLQESQFGLASVQFRWNVSGTYMQVIPRFISTDTYGNGEREFLSDYFDDPNEIFSNIFLKGYQWPFNVRAASSLLDIFVHIETVEKRRRVFLDFRRNPANLSLAQLDSEAKSYLEQSGALFGTPIERLETMNPAAIQLFADHGIDLRSEPLEIAVCAQHNNGGLAGTHWWESTNIKHLFPIGEVNGSHGVARPGGAALNAGQAGAFRAAEYIANRYADWTLDVGNAEKIITEQIKQRSGKQNENRTANVQAIRRTMSQYGGMIRPSSFESSVEETTFCLNGSDDSLAIAAKVYLDAIRFSAVQTGSRGSGLVLNNGGVLVHPKLDEHWKMQLENEEYRKKVLVSSYDSESGVSTHRWEECRPIPQNALWFETAWKEYREGMIYD
jgi:succinate dehydrogenase/fumarate reductase flavoprotein subunit